MWKIRAIFFSFPVVVIATIVMGSIALVCSLWDRDGNLQHRVARRWSRMLLAAAFARCRVSGLERIDPNRSYVVVSNHASYMDIPSILSSIPLQLRFFAKKGLFSVPFLGWYLKRAEYFEVNRSDARARLRSMSEAATLLRARGVSVLVFPEGGRTEKGLRPFKGGAAYLAIKAGVPLIPLGLVNTRAVLPMHSLLLRSGTIEVRIGDPVETAGMTLHDRARLDEILYRRIAELIGETVTEGVSAGVDL